VLSIDAPAAPATVTRRAATDADEAFLRVLYADARADEVATFGWPPNEVQAFLTIQFDAQRRHVRSVHPDSVDAVVLVGDVPAGRLWTHRGDALTVIDIALLEPHRRAGIGGRLLRDVQADAAAHGVPVDVRVLRTNRARHLYERLGFRPVAADGALEDSQRLALRWNPPGPAEWASAVGTSGLLGGLPAVVLGRTAPHGSLRFRIPAGGPLPAGTYRFTHPTLGAVDVVVERADGPVVTATVPGPAR
jgi:ribosomal protein S18 acetylase RimI-like enzyme